MENMSTTTGSLIRKFPDVKASIDALGSIDGDFGDVPAGKSALAVMGEVGDTKILWDPEKPDEVDAARTLFNSLKAKRYRPFKVTGKEGLQGEQMDEFDPKEGRMIMVPALVGG